MNFSKLSTTELKEFIDLNAPEYYVGCAQKLFDEGFNLLLTKSMEDALIAESYTGDIPQLYHVEELRSLSKEELEPFAEALGIKNDRERIISVLGRLGALYEHDNYDERFEFLLKLSYDEIVNICSKTTKYGDICDNVDFWRKKVCNDFDNCEYDFDEELAEIKNPREVYLSLFIKRYLQGQLPGKHTVILTNIEDPIEPEEMLNILGQFGDIIEHEHIGGIYLITCDKDHCAREMINNSHIFDGRYIASYQ